MQKIQIVFADFEMQQDTVSRAQPVITVTPTLELTNPNDIEVTFVKLEMELRGSPELVQLEQRRWAGGQEDSGRRERSSIARTSSRPCAAQAAQSSSARSSFRVERSSVRPMAPFPRASCSSRSTAD
jgi:uncharacterized protein (DUF58 family)